MPTDPVCGMDVSEEKGFASEYGKTKFHFCSYSCQSEFERNPDQYARPFEPLTVNEIMSTEVDAVESGSSALEVSKLMSSKRRGCVLVQEGGSYVGIITERDLVGKVLAENLSPASLKAADVMTAPLIAVAPEAAVEEASKTMSRYSIRRLPVVKDGILLGLVTVADIAMQMAKEKQFKDHRLNALAKYCVSPGTPPYG